MKQLIAAAVLLVAVAGCSSSKDSGKHVDSHSCEALVGKSVETGVQCTTPTSGTISPTAFPCYAEPGTSFYYINFESKKYIFGRPGEKWRALPYTESLGPVAVALGC